MYMRKAVTMKAAGNVKMAVVRYAKSDLDSAMVVAPRIILKSYCFDPWMRGSADSDAEHSHVLMADWLAHLDQNTDILAQLQGMPRDTHGLRLERLSELSIIGSIYLQESNSRTQTPLQDGS